jgi:hypothetical protein
MPDRDALAKIKASLQEARSMEKSIEDMEARLTKTKTALFTLQHKTLPEAFNAAGLSSLTIEAKGNLPPMKCDLRPWYKAVIPAKWSMEKRNEALAELDKHNAGDLAKRVISVTFPRSAVDDAKELAEKLEGMGYSFEMTFEIPWMTLTAWLKETVAGGTMPDLEKIGGQVGQVVNLKPVDED